MIKYSYYNDFLEIYLETHDGEVVLFENWATELESPVLFNVCNDLKVNGVAALNSSRKITIN